MASRNAERREPITRGTGNVFADLGFPDAAERQAKLRLAYALDYGVPDNWERISYGADTSDYPHNGFIWERIGLKGWREAAGRVEWDIEWEAMQGVTFYRGR